MAKGLNQVNLVFTADTAQARRAIQELQSSLNSIATGAALGGGEMKITKEIHEAMNAAAELKVHLQNATNVNTGNLDFSKLSSSLKKSGMTLDQYAAKLQTLGPAGSKAFTQLASAVAKSEIPIKRSNTTLQQFATTLKNTARWQISSSLLHGFVGAVQSAYHYAQDLNQSLNNIRIVTGQSIDQMDRFAAKANKAAKALSTSTTSYTNAALIYYQQGLNNKEVEERTTTTIKMANVSRQSAEEVSSQMTAIWNNFDNGSKSLEYYGDVITALGAKTAASSSEIATGLEKFAAVSKTIGLSYEYASAALATIVAQTRQSADTVGTALRTIFSRLEGLKLGEKLDDGTDLNKYSKALQTVGVNIKDASGQLKDMDTILDDLGGKWQNLTKDQQVALAQTVGGVRQYTNLIALMDNWDTMKANVQIAQTSEGTLQNQADIYAESWEAASKRVKATAESLYTTILNDEGFIKLTNGIAEAIGWVEKLIKMLGGVPGVLALIGSISTRIFQQEMIQHLQNVGDRIKLAFPGYRKKLAADRDMAYSNMIERTRQMGADGQQATEADRTNSRIMAEQLGLQREFARRANYLSPEQRARVQQGMDRVEMFRQSAADKAEKYETAAGQRKEKTNEEYNAQEKALRDLRKDYNNEEAKLRKQKESGEISQEDFNKQYGVLQDKRKINNEQLRYFDSNAVGAGNKPGMTAKQAQQTIDTNAMKSAYLNKFENLIPKNEKGQAIKIDVNTEEGKKKIEELKRVLQQAEEDKVEIGVTVKEDGSIEGDIDQIKAKIKKETDKSVDTLNEAGLSGADVRDRAEQTANDRMNVRAAEDRAHQEGQGVKEDINAKGKGPGIAQQLTSVAQLATSTAAAIMSIRAAWDTVNNPDASGFEKVTAVLMALGTVIPVVISLFTALLPAGEAAGAGMTAAMGPVGWIILGLMALVAVIAIVVSSFDSLAKQAKKAAEAAEKMAEAAEEAQKAADDLRNSIDKYDSAIDKLKECTKGTKEWKEALLEVNKAAMDVLEIAGGRLSAEEYHALSEAISEGKDIHKVTLKDANGKEYNVLDKAQKEADATASRAAYASDFANYKATMARLAVTKQGLAHNITDSRADVQSAKNWMTGSAAVSAGLASVPALYTAGISGMVYGYRKTVNNAYNEKQVNAHFDELVDASDSLETFKTALEKAEIDISGMSDTALSQFANSIREAGNAAESAKEQLSLLTKLKLDEFLGDEFSKAEKNFAAAQQEKYREEYTKYWYDLMTGSGIGWADNQNNEVYQQVLTTLQAAGYDVHEHTSNAVQGWDNNRSLAFRDSQGKEIIWSATQISEMLGAYQAMEQAGVDAEHARTLINGIDTDQGRKFANNAMTNFNDVTGQFDFTDYMQTLTAGELAALQKGMTYNAETGEYGISQKALNQLGLTEEQFRALIDGFGADAKTVVDDFNTTAQQLSEGISEAGLDAIPKKLHKSFQQLTSDDSFTIEGKTIIAKQMRTAFENAGGGEAGELAAKTVEDFYKQFSEKDRQKVAEALKDIDDWSDMSVDGLKEKLYSVGFSFKELENLDDSQLKSLIETLKEITELSFDNLSENYKNLHKAIDKIEIGDTISADDYKLLSDAGKKYFVQMLDGTYQLVKDAKELKKVEEANQQKNFQELHTQNAENLERMVTLRDMSTEERSKYTTNAFDAAVEEQRKNYQFTDSELQILDKVPSSIKNSVANSILNSHAEDFAAAAANDAKTHTGEQLDLLEQFIPELQEKGLASATDISNLRTAWENGTLNPDDYQKVTDLISQLGINSEVAAEKVTELEKSQENLEVAMQIAGKTADEVNTMYGAEAEAATHAAALNDAAKAGYDMEEFVAYSKTVRAEAQKNAKEGEEISESMAERLAYDNMQISEGLEDLKSGWKEWGDAIKNKDKDLLKYSKAIQNLNKFMKQLTGTTDDFSDEFLTSEENMELFEKAAKGDKEAIESLQKAAGKEKLKVVDDEALKSAEGRVANLAKKIGEGFENIDPSGALQKVQEAVDAADLSEIKIGTSLDAAGLSSVREGLQALADSGAMTADQISTYLESIGFEPDISYEEVTVDSSTVTQADGFTTFTDVNGATHTVTNDAFADISGDQKIKVPIINGKKKGGGGGGSSGGGGGGGKKKHIEKKQPEEAKDRYHVVKNQLEEQESQYKRIDTAYQRAFGKSKLDLLDKQIAKQKELIKTQKQYLDEAKEYLKYDKQQLELDARKQVYNEETNEYTTVDTSVAGLGMSIEWNDTGGIDNIDAIMKANLDRYNAEIDRINEALDSGKMTQEEADWAQKLAEAQYQGLLDTIGQYEETQDFVNEKLQDLIDAQNQYYDQLLEKTKLRVQLRVEVDEDSLNLINFLLERLEADAYKAAQRIDKLGDSFAASADKMDAYKWGLIDLLANHGDENAEGTFAKLMAGEITPEQLLQQMQEGGNVFTQAEADAIREYMQNIMAEATEQLEIQKKVIEEIGTVLEENNRRLDRQIGKIEHLQNVMSSYKNIIDLSGRQFLGITSEIYDAMEEANVKLANDTLEADKARMDASNAWLQKIKEDYAAVYDTLTDEAKKAYEEQIEAAEDAAQEATEAYYSSWEAAIEAINTRFESAMQHMAEDFSKTMAGIAGNLEGVQQRMDLRKMVADVYVPEYEKMYQLTKLTREAQKSIDNASNVKVKQELLRVQQKIVEAQESGAKISQYELDYLQRELDLKAAQMALEEASKAKSQVRMTRDSEGNYAYVYTANEEAVEEAEQNYADKLYEMQKLNEEYVASLQDMLVELESNYIQALQDAAETYGKGTEEYASAVADIQSQYGTYFDELMSEMGLVLSNNKETETIHAEIYKRLTGDVYQANVDLQTSWEETTLAGVTGYETLGQYQTAWAAASQKAYDDVIQANDIWMASMAEAYNLAGESIDTFAQTVGGDFEQIKEESQSLKKQIVEEDLPAMTEAINKVSESVKSWQETYAEAIKTMLEDTKKMIAKYNELLAAWSKVDQKHQAAEQQGNANDANSSTGTQTNGNNSNNNNGNTKSSSSGGGGSSGSTGNQGGYGGSGGSSGLIGGNNAIRNLTMLRFASGGYTGDWAGDEGKIAVLDRKELVLNAQDTFNILKAVDMIKTISQTIDINAMSAGGAFSNLISPFVSDTGDRLEQEVHITAEFPNVTNKNEILEAFDNVINLASQYANR